MGAIKTFFILYIIVIAGIYALTRGGKTPVVIPGDYYKRMGPRTVYIPLATSLLVTIILFIIVRSIIG